MRPCPLRIHILFRLYRCYDLSSHQPLDLSPVLTQIWISFLGALMGFCSYGPIAIFGVVANECVPTSIAGTAYAIASIFANSKISMILYKDELCLMAIANYVFTISLSVEVK